MSNSLYQAIAQSRQIMQSNKIITQRNQQKKALLQQRFSKILSQKTLPNPLPSSQQIITLKTKYLFLKQKLQKVTQKLLTLQSKKSKILAKEKHQLQLKNHQKQTQTTSLEHQTKSLQQKNLHLKQKLRKNSQIAQKIKKQQQTKFEKLRLQHSKSSKDPEIKRLQSLVSDLISQNDDFSYYYQKLQIQKRINK